MEQRQEEWREHETQVMHLLEHPHLLPEQKSLGKRQLVLQLWHYPAFDPLTVWLVYRGETCLLREVVWDRQTDASRILDPLEGLKYGFQTAPSFHVRTVELTCEEIESRLVTLKQISLSPFTGCDTVWLDGELFGIAVGADFTATRVSWRGGSQSEWHEMKSWFYETTEYFAVKLAEKPACK